MPIITTSLREMSPEWAIDRNFFEDSGIKTPVQRAIFVGKCALPLFESFSRNFLSMPSFVFSTFAQEKQEKGNQRNVVVEFGTHPLPSEENFKVSLSLKYWLQKTKGSAAVFISGGATSLLFLPPEGIPANEVIKTERELLLKGVQIKELNFVRMALSELRGGGVAELLKPYPFFGFVWCDVEPEDYLFVGSAPLGGPEIDVKREAERVLRKWDIRKNFEIPEKKVGPIPEECSILKIADGQELCRKIKKKLREEKINCKIIKIKEGTPSFQAAEKIFTESNKIKKPAVLLGNGEFLVNANNEGKGGRCSHLVANVAKLFYGQKGWFFAALATDGVDGSGDGGAFVHSEAKMDLGEIEKALKNCNTANLFRKKRCFLKENQPETI